MTRKMLVNAIAIMLYGTFSLCASAQDSSAQTIIDGSVGSNAHGALSVNMAAGDSNVQSNATAIAAGTSNGQASAHASTDQIIDSTTFNVPEIAVTRISNNAFNNASGLIKINQAAGAANAQANNVALAVGAEVAADTALAQNVSGLAPEAMEASGQQREAVVDEAAFRGAHGIVQVNQSAGIANASGNNFTMRVHLGALQ